MFLSQSRSSAHMTGGQEYQRDNGDVLKFAIIMLSTLLLLSIFLVPNTSSLTATQGPGVSNILTVTKLHTNATAISACTINSFTANGSPVTITGTLFGRIRIILNVTWSNSNMSYLLVFANFYLLVTQKNMVIANVTNINQNQNPTNLVQSVILFPKLPVILILSFQPVCVTAGSLARLIYIDGSFNFVFDLP